MKRDRHSFRLFSFSLSAALAATGTLALLGLAAPASAQVAVTPPFEQSAYLFNQTYDTTYTGDGSWGQYRAWLNLPQLGVETDGGGSVDDWWGSCEDPGWNFAWGTQQADPKYAGAMPDILLGDWQMPYLSNGQYDQTWALEAANDPATMQHFVQFAANVLCTPGMTNNHWSGYVASVAAKSVIVRLGYEFDGGWNPYGNLSGMSNMPNNYIQSWRNIVTTVRAHDPSHVIKFCWNPTDSNVQINTDSFYPGDAWVDYIALDTYDKEYSGTYQKGIQPSAAAQASVWQNTLLPRLNHFRDLAVAHGKPLIVGEWGTWDLNSAPGGGDDPGYVQNMFNWMSDPSNHVYMEDYYDIPASDGDHQLWPGLNKRQTAFPNAALKYRSLFGVTWSFGTSAAAVPGSIRASDYDTGGQGIAYNYPQNGGSYSSYRSGDLVGLEACSEGGDDVGWTGAGDWLKYTVNVASAGTYAATFRVASGAGGGTFHLQTLTGIQLSGAINAPGTGGWQNWANVTANVTLSAGPQVLVLCEDTGGYNVESLAFAGGQPALVANGTYTLTNRYATALLVDDPGNSTATGTQLILWTSNGGSNQKWQLTNLGGDVVRLTSALNGLTLGVRGGSTGNGGIVEQNTWTGATSQQWHLSATGGGYYTLTNKNSGLVLDDPGGSTNAGTGLMQFQYGGGSIDQWRFQ